MRKWPKRIFILLLILTGMSLGFWLWFEYKYEDFVRRFVLTEINKRLKVKVKAESAELNFWRTFPRLSLTIKNIQIANPEGTFLNNVNCGGGMGRAERLSFIFNLTDILRGKPNIKRIEMSEFCFALQELDDEKNNYDIFRSDSLSDKSMSMQLEKIVLYDGIISFENKSAGQFHEIEITTLGGKGNFSPDHFSLEIETDAKLLRLQTGKTDYGAGKELHGIWQISGKGQTKKIGTSKCKLEDIVFSADGSFNGETGNKIINIHFITEDTQIQHLLSLLPVAYSKWRSDYSGDGIVSIKSNISWNLENDITKAYTILSVKEALLKESQSNIEARNIESESIWKYESHATNHVTINHISARIGESFLKAAIEIDLGLLTSFSGIAEGDMNLRQWNTFLKTDSLVNLSGNVKGKMVFKGYADNILHLTSASGSIQLEDASMQIPAKELKFDHVSGLISGNNDLIAIKELNLEYNQTKFKGRGLVPLGEKAGKEIILDLSIPEFRAENWEGDNNSGKAGILPWPEDWSIKTRIKIKDYHQSDFHAKDVEADVVLQKKQIELEQVNFKTMGGNAEGKGVLVFPPDGGIQVSLLADLHNINLSELFKDLNNFGQKTLTNRNISGTAEANIFFTAMWNSRMQVLDSSIETRAHVKVSKGELSDFSPLYSLSDHIEVEELKHIRFSELENQITIKDKKIFIPEMEINSSALNLKCSGIHEFNQDIDYRFSVLLNDILYKKYRSKKRKGDAFGRFEEELPESNTRIEIRMSGNMEKPIFELNKKALKKEFANEFRKEGKTLKKLFVDEIQGKGNSENEKKWSFEKSETMFDLENTGTMPPPTKKTDVNMDSEKSKDGNRDEKKKKKKNKLNFNESEKSNPDYN